jgi:RNA polymerase sigma factor (sigma-70 family)
MAAGDERALEEIYRSVGSVVLSYLSRVAGREAEDLLQVVFFELWRSRERIDPEMGLEGFLFMLARRRALDVLRRHRPETVAIEAANWLVGEDGDAFVERFVQAARVKRALDDLPARQREPLVLAYFGGRTQQEISDATGVPMGTVKARMSRGMRRLSVSLTEPRS